jgi:hypothetical protein
MTGTAWAVPDVVRRSKKATFYHEPGDPANKYSATFTIHDQNYQDEGGVWQSEVEDFETGDATWDMKADKMNHRIWVKANTGRRWYPRRNVTGEYVDIGAIEYYTNRWRTLSPGPLNHFMNTLYWESSDIKIELIPVWNRMKFNAVLKTSAAPARMRVLNIFVGLMENNGVLTSTTSGETVGYLMIPTAVDADSMTVTVTTAIYSGYFEFSVSTAGHTFPIVVDPTFTLQPDGTAGKDTHNSSSAVDTNYATNNAMVIRTGVYNLRGFIEFDVSTFPVTGTVQAATMTLVSNSATYGGPTIQIFSLASGVDTWTEDGLTWNNYKAGTTWPGSAGCSTADTDYESTVIGSAVFPNTAGASMAFDLSATRIGQWMTGSNYGLRIWDVGGHAKSDTSKLVRSSDYSDAATRPKIDIYYTESGGETPTATRRRVGRGFRGF